MNYKEALDILDKTFIGNLEAKALITKAVLKQIETKVTHEASLYRCCTCPSCGNVVDKFEKFGESIVRVEYLHCHYCGQALDYSDERRR